MAAEQLFVNRQFWGTWRAWALLLVFFALSWPQSLRAQAAESLWISVKSNHIPFPDFWLPPAKWVAQNKLCGPQTSQDFQNSVFPCYLYKASQPSRDACFGPCYSKLYLTCYVSWCGGSRWAGNGGPISSSRTQWDYGPKLTVTLSWPATHFLFLGLLSGKDFYFNI